MSSGKYDRGSDILRDDFADGQAAQVVVFFFQAEDGIRDVAVTGVQTCALPIRLRLGCGPDHPLGSRKEYVLRPMKKAELEVAAEMIGEAGDAVEMILSQGIDAAMTKYNRRKPADPEELEEK